MTREQRARKALGWLMQKTIEHERLKGVELTEQQAFQKVIDLVRVGEKMRDFKEVK